MAETLAVAHPFALFQELGLACTGVLQIGASSSQEGESIAASGARVTVLVEPLLQPYRAVAEVTLGHRGMMAVRDLCSGTSGREVAVHVASNGGMLSGILLPTGHRDVHPQISFKKSKGFRTVTVDDLMREVAQKTATSLSAMNNMIIDVQGAEPAVLAGASITLAQIDHIFCEVSLGGLYEGDLPLEEDLGRWRLFASAICEGRHDGRGRRASNLSKVRYAYRSRGVLRNVKKPGCTCRGEDRAEASWQRGRPAGPRSQPVRTAIRVENMEKAAYEPFCRQD